MIADFVNFAIVGIDFCHAASRLILRRALRGMNTVMAQSWTRRQTHY
jgi:hypothetical protein